MGITLLDVDCILIEQQSEFHVEYNEEEKTLSLEEVLEIIHNKKIKYIDSTEEDHIFIRFENEESLFIGL